MSHDLPLWVEDYTVDLFSWALHKTSDEEESSMFDNEDFQLVLKNCMQALPEKWWT
ncbi:hypothetical protein ACFLSP_05160 [Bacteroidota bacterium]